MELESFFDGLMAVSMKQNDVAGAAISLVQGGRLIFSKGYGYEDVERRVPVDPATTVFRPGSVSKLFTWTAVMQLVEDGKLDLDTDVNTYLRDFKIPPTYSQPVTLRNLMTHTPGFEDGGLGFLFGDSPQGLDPLGTALLKHMPARVRPPTTDFSSAVGSAYSNWGAALAGHIVATVSGLPFDDYVERRILQPLAMRRTTFREPLPESLAAHFAQGYSFEGGEFKRHGFEYIHPFGPAGSMSSTATDMANFMIAQLHDGAFGPTRILREQTAQLLHTRALSPDPATSGMTLGFGDYYLGGRRMLGHSGATLFFNSLLTLIPETDTGIFIATNTASGSTLLRDTTRAFIDRYFPSQLPQLTPPKGFAARADRYAGVYRSLRRSYTLIDKLIAIGEDIRVQALPDDTLMLTTAGPDKVTRWIEVGDGVFRRRDDGSVLAFKGDSEGRARYLVGLSPAAAAERVSWYETAMVHALLVGLAVILFVTSIVSAIRQREADRGTARAIRWARPALAVTGALGLLFLVLLAISLADTTSVVFHLPATLKVALALPLLALITTAASIASCALAWRRRAWSLGSRLHYTVATGVAAGYLCVLWYWNLLGYHFG